MHKVDQPSKAKNHSTDSSSDSSGRWWTYLEPPSPHILTMKYSWRVFSWILLYQLSRWVISQYLTDGPYEST